MPIASAAWVAGENWEELSADVARILLIWSIAEMTVARFSVLYEKKSRECHRFLWSTGTGWKFHISKKPVPVAWVLDYLHRDLSHV